MLFVADSGLFGLASPLRVIALALVAFALTYVIVRFALVGLAIWVTVDEDNSMVGHVGQPIAKLLAFCNALAIAGSAVAIDLPLVWSYGASVVFVLAAVVYRFERLLGKRRTSP